MLHRLCYYFSGINLVIAFLLELAMLVIYSFFGHRLLPGDSPPALKIGTAILLPGLLAVVWGFWLAPRAAKRLQMPWLLIAKAVIFGVGAVMLWGLGNTPLAIIAVVMITVHLVLSALCKQT
jgi:hypothetical protein